GRGDVRMAVVVDLHARHLEAGGANIGIDLLAQLGQDGPGAHDGKARKRFAHRRGRLAHPGTTQEEVEEPHKRPPVNMRPPHKTHSRANRPRRMASLSFKNMWETRMTEGLCHDHAAHAHWYRRTEHQGVDMG